MKPADRQGLQAAFGPLAWQDALTSAIRCALPSLASRPTRTWKTGTCQVPVDGSGLVQDLHLNWRTAEQQKVAERSATHGFFDGHARVMGAGVDFMGEYSRDGRTGALLRFGIECLGGPGGG